MKITTLPLLFLCTVFMQTDHAFGMEPKREGQQQASTSNRPAAGSAAAAAIGKDLAQARNHKLFEDLSKAKTAVEAMTILDLIPEADRAALVKMQNRVGRKTVLHNASSPEVAIAILNAVPEAERAACVRMRDRDESTALFYARSAAAVMAILNAVPEAERAAYARMRDRDGRTALFHARSAAEVTTILHAVPEAERVEFIRVQDGSGTTALYHARSEEIAMAILNALPDRAAQVAYIKMRNNVDQTVLFLAPSAARVMMILNVLPESERATYAKTENFLGQTALHQARTGDVATAILNAFPDRAERVAYIRLQDKSKKTALHEACFKDDATRIAVAILHALPEGERVNLVGIQDEFGCTALHYAASNPIATTDITTEVLNTMLEIDRVLVVNIQHSNGDTVLHRALREASGAYHLYDAMTFKNRIRGWLIQPGIDINVRNIENRRGGRTAREINPEVFDECAMAANGIITTRDVQRSRESSARSNITHQVLCASGLLIKPLLDIMLAYVGEFQAQPLIAIPGRALLAPTGVAAPAGAATIALSTGAVAAVHSGVGIAAASVAQEAGDVTDAKRSAPAKSVAPAKAKPVTIDAKDAKDPDGFNLVAYHRELAALGGLSVDSPAAVAPKS
jgi:ankyrin repeat protein